MTESLMGPSLILIGWCMLILTFLVVFSCLFDWNVEQIIGITFMFFLGVFWFGIAFSLIL
mgnify:CR=1 FL=1